MKSAAPLFDTFRPVLRRRVRAFSLVVTLIIVSMLAVVAIGFLSSMSSERATADAFGSKSRAEQAAQAGVDSATAILRQAFKDFPDSATAWEAYNENSDGSDTVDVKHPVAKYNEGTNLYVRAMPSATNPGQPDPSPTPVPASTPGSGLAPAPNGPSNLNPTTGADARSTFVLPLISGASYRPWVTKGTAVNGGSSFNGKDKNAANQFVDLNVLRYKDDPQGWIGSPPAADSTGGWSTAVVPKTMRVPWVEITQPDAKDPAKAPVVARYAFWVEDESFRTNINHAGLGTASASPTPAAADPINGRRKDNTANYSLLSPQPPPYVSPTPAADLPINASSADLNGLLQSPPELTDSSNGGEVFINKAEPYAKALLDLRSFYPGGLFPESSAYSHLEVSAQESTKRLEYNLADQLRFLTTTTSSGLNLSRHGSQRVSLNNLIYPNRSTTYNAKQAVDAIISTIQFHAPNFGQRFYRNIGSWGATAYRSNILNALTVKGETDPLSPLHDHKLIYLNKIAANVVDYIDADNVPTFIDQTGTIKTGVFILPPRDLLGFESSNNASPIWANGKENLPYMDECAARFRLMPPPAGQTNRYHLIVDYYIEVWNMSGRDITPQDLGGDALVRISQPPPWVGNSTPAAGVGTDTYVPCDDADGVSPSSSRGFPCPPPDLDNPRRDFDIDISGVTFKAGRCTVITTDSDAADGKPGWQDIITNWKDFNNPPGSSNIPPNVVVCSFLDKRSTIPGHPGKREYHGAIPIQKGTANTRCKVLHIPPGITYSNTSSSDYKTSVILYSPSRGYFDLLEGAIPMANSGAFSMNFPAPLPAGTPTTTAYKAYGGSLRGNTGATPFAPSTTGDPRTNNEQMDYVLYVSGGPSDQSRYFNFTYGTNAGASSDSSLGYPNFNFTKPNVNTGNVTPWPDYVSPWSPDPTNLPTKNSVIAPAVYANAPLTSIGQLGDVYDPSRWVGGLDSRTLNAARGGGRTLKIGQHDDRWDGNPMSASHSWASWRLADFFCTDDAMLQPGLINLNGVGRDNGAALRAALSGLKFQKNAPNGRGASKLESAVPLNIAPRSSTLTPNGLDVVVNQIKKRIAQLPSADEDKWGTLGFEPQNTGRGPFFERGELSELPAFGRNLTTTTYPPPPEEYKAIDLATSPTGGVNLGEVDDRGREEIFRRLVEMTTTRGNVFTVYAMGQAISQSNPEDPRTKKVMSTQRMKVTFRLVPKEKSNDNTSPYGANDFHPATDKNGASKPFDPNNRFVRPDHYDIQILSSSKGGG